MFSKLSDRDEFGFLNRYRSARAAGIGQVSGALLDIVIENSMPVDVSGNNYQINVSGGAAAEIDGITAWHFDGNYISIEPKGEEFVFNRDFTISMMLYPTASSRQAIFAYQHDYVFALPFSYNGDSMPGCFFNGGWGNHEFPVELPMNCWSHVKFVYTGSKITCYVDGSPVGRVDIECDYIGEPDQYIAFGRWGGDPGDFSQRWQGYMAEIQIWAEAV